MPCAGHTFMHPDPYRRVGLGSFRPSRVGQNGCGSLPGPHWALKPTMSPFSVWLLTCTPTGNKTGQDARRSASDLEPEREKPCFFQVTLVVESFISQRTWPVPADIGVST